jgi:hypothetical protein
MGSKIRWSRSATRHRISRERSAHAVRTAEAVFREPAPAGSPLADERIVFLGTDPNGVVLEVMAVEIEQGLLIIHAMPVRPKYTSHLESEQTADDDEEDQEDDA